MDHKINSNVRFLLQSSPVSLYEGHRALLFWIYSQSHFLYWLNEMWGYVNSTLIICQLVASLINI